MKKIIMLITVCAMLVGLCACQKKNEEEPTTLGNQLAAQFAEEIKKSEDINAVANALMSNENIEFDLSCYEVSEGFLNGFDADITGFEQGVCLAPFIGSIPFVAYIFKTNDTAALKKMLEEHADQRWNICTEAAETVVTENGNYVFFTMCPGEDE